MDIRNNYHVNASKRFSRLMNFIESSNKAQTIVAWLIILIFIIINTLSVVRGFSLTTDEDKHYLYAQNIVSGNTNRIDDSKMPATALNALPQKFASFLAEGKIKNFLGKYYVARLVTTFFSCLVAFLVFYWARSLYGFIPALFSLVLYVFDPNIIAHSHLVTNDLYVTGAFAFAFFTLWKFANQRTLKNGLLCVFALGIAQLAKYTAIILFPLFFIALFINDLQAWIESLLDWKKLRALVAQYFKYVAWAALAVTLIINFGFLFNRTLMQFGEYRFLSDIFQSIQARFPILGRVPVPVPYPYLQGLDWMRNTEQSGALSGNVYLLGRVSPLDGFPGYYIVASLLKVPISTQIILILAHVVYFTRKTWKGDFLRNGVFLLLPFIFFTIYFNFFFNTQIGIRYYLPVFPLLYVFAGNLFVNLKGFPVWQKVSVWGLLVYLIVSVLSYHPYYLSYFNEIVWDRKDAYKYLADSNLDWGQGKNELRQYLEEHPGALYAPKNVRPGRLVVRVNDLVGVTEDPAKYAWLRDNFEPIETIAYSYLVYKISPEDIERLCTTTTYCDR